MIINIVSFKEILERVIGHSHNLKVHFFGYHQYVSSYIPDVIKNFEFPEITQSQILKLVNLPSNELLRILPESSLNALREKLEESSSTMGFSYSTLDLLYELSVYKLRFGLMFKDFFHLIVFVLIIKFFIYRKKYGWKSAIRISLICLAASWFWVHSFDDIYDRLWPGFIGTRFFWNGLTDHNQYLAYLEQFHEELSDLALPRHAIMDPKAVELFHFLREAYTETRFTYRFSIPQLEQFNGDLIKNYSGIKEAQKALFENSPFVKYNFSPEIGNNFYTFNKGEILRDMGEATIEYRDYIDEQTLLEYYSDPFAMLIRFSQVHQIAILSHPAIEKLYYFWIRLGVSAGNKALDMYIFNDIDTIVYFFVVRKGRLTTPYLIRWHFTMNMLIFGLWNYWLNMWYRLWNYQHAVVLPQLQEEFDDVITNDRYYSSNRTFFGALNKFGISTKFKELVKKYDYTKQEALLYSFTLPHAKEHALLEIGIELGSLLPITFYIYGFLHALCGQFFYIPFITESVEMNVGYLDAKQEYFSKRPAWTDKDYKSDNPFGWFGWFGRGTDKPSLITLFWLLLKWIIFKFLKLLRIRKLLRQFIKFVKTKFKK